MRDVDTWQDDSDVLFRSDSRAPHEILPDGGFKMADADKPVDFLQHVHGQTNAFVSTSTNPEIAIGFGAAKKDDDTMGYVYRVKAPGGILTDKTQDRAGDNRTRYAESEVVFPGGIRTQYIEGWHKIEVDSTGKRTLGPFVPNPAYIGGRRADAPKIPENLRPEAKWEPPPELSLVPKHLRTDDAREGPDRDQQGQVEHDQAPGVEKPDTEHRADPPRNESPADHTPAANSDNRISRLLDGEPEPSEQAPPKVTPPTAIHAGTGDDARQRDLLERAFPGIEGVNSHNADRPLEDGYGTNCVEALIADEHRYHGEVVEAKPTRPEDVATEGRLSRVRDALGGDWTSHPDFDSVVTAMADTPVGSRAAVAFRFTDEDGRAHGHVVRVAHTDEGIAFADPQTGKLAALPPDATDVRLLSADYTDETAHSVVPADGGYGQTPQEQRDSAVSDVADDLGIADPSQRQALADTYDVTREYTAPIIVEIAARMQDDLKALVAADPAHRVVFLGRDGHSLALASRALDPAFFDRHASEVVLSRAVVEAALRDIERGDPNRDFSAVDDYRLRKKVADDDVPGAFDRLTDYLDAAGVPVLREAGISLVDTSYKGTVQELLTAAYPDPTFRGHYAFHGQSPDDPHPDAKKGYLVDLGPEDGAGRPLVDLPDDVVLTFAHQDAIGLIEETLHGTMSSPRGIGESGPTQQPQRFEPDPLSGINPVKVAGPFTDPAVREGAKAVALRAVVDVADEVAARRDADGEWRAELAAAAERGQAQVRAWVAQDQTADPRMREVMDSLVRRGDKHAVKMVEDSVRDLGVAERHRVWTEFAALQSIHERVEFAERLRGGKN